MPDEIPVGGGQDSPARSLPSLAVVLAVLPVLAAGARVWLYSAGDMALFLLLLRTLDVTAVLVGTGVLLIPVVVWVLAVVILTDWRVRDLAKRSLENHRWLGAAILVLLGLMLLTTSWTRILTGVGILGVLAVAYFAIRRFWPWGKRVLSHLITERGDENGPDSAVTVFMVVIIVLVAPTSMWLPLERVDLANGEHPVAYVLESTAEWTTLLTPGRQIEIRPTEEIHARTICRLQPGRSFATFIFPSGLIEVPDCSIP